MFAVRYRIEYRQAIQLRYNCQEMSSPYSSVVKSSSAPLLSTVYPHNAQISACRSAATSFQFLYNLPMHSMKASTSRVAAPVHRRANMNSMKTCAVKYKGLAVQAPQQEFKLWEYDQGPLGPTEVEINVTHNGLCHTDLHMKDDDWGLTAYPLIPGHEVVGTVRNVGSDVQGLKEGDRVGVGWIRDSCRRCKHCLRGNENLCVKGYTGLIVGAGNFGGFQPVMRAPADFTYVIPEKLGSAEAAPLLCAGITVYAPLRKHIRQPDAKVAVLGVGGLGHLAIQFANKMGAEVTAVDLKQEKEAEAHDLGAAHFVSFDKAYEDCKGKFDVIINCVSAKLDFPKVLGMLSTDGVAIQCGIPGGGALIDLPLQDVVFNQKSMAGSIVGGRADMQEMLEFCSDKGVAPLVEIMKLSQLNEALEKLKAGKPRYRIVMETDI